MVLKETGEAFKTQWVRQGLLCISALGTILLISWFVGYSAYGLDFSDEGFHLVWIASPFSYDASITLFGFVYHPLYVLLDGSIAALRKVNIAATFVLAAGLVYAYLGVLAPQAHGRSAVRLTVALGMAASALFVFDWWLLTPSYYSLALQALMITSIGLLLADNEKTFKSLAGSVSVGVGGWLAFMAKPSTAAALAIGVALYLIVSRKLSLRVLLPAVVSAVILLLLSALIIDGSVTGFARRLQLGLTFGQYLGGGHTLIELLRIDNFQLNTQTKQLIVLVTVVSVAATWTALSERPAFLICSLLICAGLFAVLALLALGQISGVADLGQFAALAIFGVMFAAILVGLGRMVWAGGPRVTADQWGIALLFLVMPHIYAFGTNGNYWESGGQAGIFWLLAGVTLLGPIAVEKAAWSFALPLALVVQVTTAIVLHGVMEKPYRQPQPVALNETTLEIGPNRSALRLSSGYADYIREAASSARSAGFNPGDGIIDLSGQSPVILYALGAENLGAAWIIGGYPGSLQFAKASLERVSCEKIASAWVLYEANGPRSIPVELMQELGAAFPGQYKEVATWKTARGAGGYEESRVQQLFKPAAVPDTLKACQTLREKKAG